MEGENAPIGEAKQSSIAKFFATHWNKWVHKLRYVLIGVFLVIGIVGGIFASSIGPLTKQEEYLPSDDPFMLTQEDVFSNFVQQGFFASEANLKGSVFVNLNWGVKELES